MLTTVKESVCDYAKDHPVITTATCITLLLIPVLVIWAIFRNRN